MTDELTFTGERYVSWLNAAEISFEHWHRYLLATSLVTNKTVLDIACGEGYGSNLLALSAGNVIGVDIDQPTIQHASSRYSRPNLTFKVGSASHIPIEDDGSIDVAVSYETIEHLHEQNQESLMRELIRVMKPDGLLIMSTPNKRLYSDVPQYRNEYHLREFHQEEFAPFLSKYFSNFTLHGQRIYPGSYIWDLSTPPATFAEYKLGKTNDGFRFSDNPLDCLYFIALCSNGKLPSLPSSLLVDADQELFGERDRNIAILRGEVAGRDARLAEKDARLAAKDALLAEKDALLAEKDALLADVLFSLSWRATSPLRLAAAHVRKIRNRLK
jgi:ubiquinone/menaquinone biosynthesis C-methylase UbiE